MCKLYIINILCKYIIYKLGFGLVLENIRKLYTYNYIYVCVCVCVCVCVFFKKVILEKLGVNIQVFVLKLAVMCEICTFKTI